jgi:tetratricopeptide (TPR) repeat protein
MRFDKKINSCAFVVLMVVGMAQGCAKNDVVLESVLGDSNKVIAPSKPFEETLNKMEDTFQYTRVGFNLLKEGRYEQAIFEFKKLEAYGGPNWAEAQYYIAQCYDKLGQPKEALAYFEKSLTKGSEGMEIRHKEQLNYYRIKAGLSAVE